jgi:hypothetical protein
MKPACCGSVFFTIRTVTAGVLKKIIANGAEVCENIGNRFKFLTIAGKANLGRIGCRVACGIDSPWIVEVVTS